MKKIISLALSIIFILSCVTFPVMATEEELTDIASNGVAYSTSEKNTLWTPSKALNDGKYEKDTWQGWECAYPDVTPGANTASGFFGEYCGVKFTNKEYYEIYEIKFNLGLHSALGGQNAKYEVQFLVEGVWITVGTFKDENAKPKSYDTYEDAMAKDTSHYHIPAEYSFKLDTPMTTNNVRIRISEYAKNYPGGDILVFPYIYELDLIGKRGETPDLELPEGAELSANIGYHSYPDATSSKAFNYPYRAIDGEVKTFWSPKGTGENEALILNFIEEKEINKAVLNFGTYFEGVPVVDYKFNIEALVNNEWVKVAEGTSFDENTKNLTSEYTFETVKTSKLRVVFPEANPIVPEVYEFEAHLASEKTYYLQNRFSSVQVVSASKGNVAIIGTPYASHDFFPYSEAAYINDGQFGDGAKVWFSGVIDMPVYCGIKLPEKHRINKVAVYVQIPEREGDDVMGIEIQALVNGEYVTVANGESYHSAMKYTTVYEFDTLETDDIRVVYLSGNGTFANLKELEIYLEEGVPAPFGGLPAIEEPPIVLDELPEEDLDKDNEEEEQESKDAPVVLLVLASIMLGLAVCFAVAVLIIKFKNKNKEDKTKEVK